MLIVGQIKGHDGMVHTSQNLNTAQCVVNKLIYSTIGRINFEDKKFRGFRGYLLNLEIKYPCNFLYARSKFLFQHVNVVGKWLALWKYFKRAAEVKTSLPSRLRWQFISSNIFMQGRY